MKDSAIDSVDGSRRRASLLVGGVVVVVGSMALAGWMSGIEALTCLIPGTTPMKANAAIAFILCGAALILLQLPGARSRKVAQACSLLAGGIALLTLGEYAIGWDAGIDQLLFRDPGTSADSYPGRMAPNAAICMGLTAGALWLMSRPPGSRRPRILAWLGSLVLAIGLVAIIGYVVGFSVGYRWWNLTGMAIPTSLLFVLLGAAVLCFACREGGLCWSIKPALSVAFGCGLVLLVAVAALAHRSTRDLVEAYTRVKHTQAVIAKIRALRSAFDESQSAMRGYVITGDESFLPLSERAIPEARKRLPELRALTADNATQQARLFTLEQRTAEWLKLSQEIIDLRRTAGFEAAATGIAAGRDKVLMDQIRGTLDEIEKEEETLLFAREASADASHERTFDLMPLGVLGSALLVTLGVLLLNREVTRRQHVADALQHAERFKSAIINGLPAEIAVLDRKGLIVTVNEPWRRFARENGNPPLRLIDIGASYLDACRGAAARGDSFASAALAGIERVLNGSCPEFRLEYPCDSPTEARWFFMQTVPVPSEAGGAIVSHIDITPLKEASQALRASEERFRTMAEAAPILIHLADANGSCTYVNPRWRAASGLTLEEAQGQGWLKGLHEDDRATIGERWAKSVQSRGTWGYEYRFVNKAGMVTWVYGTAAQIEAANGTVLGYVGTNIDITERKKAEDALRVASQKLRLHFEQAPMAVIEWDLEFRVARWNPAAETIFGYSHAEAIGRHASFIVPESFHPHVAQIWQALLQQTGGVRSTNENVHKSGATILCEWYNTPLIDEQGTVTGAASVAMDITESRHAQQLLAWEKSALELVSSGMGLREVLEGLMHGLEKQLPGALCSILLLDEERVHLRHGAAPSLPDAYNRLIDGVAIGPQVGSCGTAAYLDRQVIVEDIAHDPLWANFHELALSHGLHACWSTPIHCSQGKILGTFAIYYREPRRPAPAELEVIARAVHIAGIAIERKQGEAQIREMNASLERRVRERTSELEAAVKELDAFSYSVSHDLRSPLRAIDGFSRMVAKDYGERLDDEGRRMLGVIRNGAQRMARLIDDLLAFSRLGRQPLQSAEIDMHAMARAVFDELAAQEAERKLQLDLHPLPPIRGTRPMIEQVWVNLISNAIKFTKGREIGVIEISARASEDGVPIYSVKDNGAGFDMRYADKLFGVFQRLHSTEEFSGTGVGLALVQRVVQRHGGRVWAEAEVGRGATFHFTLSSPSP